jgi:UDP-N-acetylmuramoyl-tripeptide--D-alanyl-D-alanine ligase
MKTTAGELAELLGADVPEGLSRALVIEDVTTDSRQVTRGQLFIGLKGDKFDGTDYAAAALQQGAALAVVERHVPELGERQLVVPDTLAALGRIAQRWRAKMPARVIAVTGSAGKTTTKDLIAAVCMEAGPTVATLATENNEIGVPKTLLRLREEDQFCVLEFGMRGPGQIKQLAEMARPEVGVITVIGDAHLGLLGSREAIAQSKAEMLQVLGASGTAVLNADDFFFPLLKGMCDCRVVSFGEHEAADVRCLAVLEESLSHVRARVQICEDIIELKAPLPGRHNLANALAAAAVGLALCLTPGQIKTGIESYGGLEMRGEIIAGPNGAVLINDAYNANPTSMAASLEMLKSAAGRKLVVFGDMLELGEAGPEAHREVGRLAAQAAVTLLVTIGELAAQAADVAEAAGVEVRVCNTPEEAAEALGPKLQAGDTVLIKGSRGMALERTVRQLLNAQ